MRIRWRLKIKMMTHKELIAKMRSQPKYKEKYDEAASEFESLRKMLEARRRVGLILVGDEQRRD